MGERRATPTEGSQIIPGLGWVGLTPGGWSLEPPWCLLLAPAAVVRPVPECAWIGLVLEDVQAGLASKPHKLIPVARGANGTPGGGRVPQAGGAAGAKTLSEKKQGTFMPAWSPASKGGECGRRWAGGLARGQTTWSSVSPRRICGLSEEQWEVSKGFKQGYGQS